MSTPLDVGSYQEYLPKDPTGPHTRVFEFMNNTDKVWTDVWIRTEPSFFGGSVSDAAGGKGNPPNMRNINVSKDGTLRQSVGLDAESTHIRFDATITEADRYSIGRNETIRIEIDFNDTFEDGEYIQITFSYKENGVELPVPGQVVVGVDRTPRDILGFLEIFFQLLGIGLKAGGGVPGLGFVSSSTVVPLADVQRKFDRLNLSLGEIVSAIGTTPGGDESATRIRREARRSPARRADRKR